jgi:hypothetical protein
VRRATWRTLVERHDDIRSERTLHIHHILRGEEVLRPVEIRAEVDSLFGDLGELLSSLVLHPESEREHLESSRVSQDGETHIHKRMQSTECLDHIATRTEVAMIVVHEHYL